VLGRLERKLATADLLIVPILRHVWYLLLFCNLTNLDPRIPSLPSRPPEVRLFCLFVPFRPIVLQRDLDPFSERTTSLVHPGATRRSRQVILHIVQIFIHVTSDLGRRTVVEKSDVQDSDGGEGERGEEFGQARDSKGVW
jgi:hypothetical protein